MPGMGACALLCAHNQGLVVLSRRIRSFEAASTSRLLDAGPIQKSKESLKSHDVEVQKFERQSVRANLHDMKARCQITGSVVQRHIIVVNHSKIQ
jgi:glutamine amidotransferase-like uncharacterized protein